MMISKNHSIFPPPMSPCSNLILIKLILNINSPSNYALISPNLFIFFMFFIRGCQFQEINHMNLIQLLEIKNILSKVDRNQGPFEDSTIIWVNLNINLLITMHPELPEYVGGQQKQEKHFFKPNQSRFSIHNAKTPVDQIQAVPKNSIDQSVCTSIGDQLKGILVKFSYVLIPRSQDESPSYVRNWDLWGPFLMCLIFAFFIDNTTTFMALIFAVFAGGIIVTFNIKILGGKISYFQSISILGYCICPIFVALIIVQVLKFFQVKLPLLRLILIIVATVWSILAARSFVGINLPEHKKFVGLYPIIVFYFFIAILMIFR